MGLAEHQTTVNVPSTATTIKLTTFTNTRVTKSMGNNGQTDNNPKTSAQKKKEKATEILFKKVDAKNEMTFINQLDFKFHNMREKVKQEMQKDEGIDETEIALPQQSMMSKLVDEFHYLFSQEERSTRIKMGHQLEDMLVDCSFAGRVCHPQNFSLRATIGMGNCFTLQHNGLVAHNSGTKDGMILIIYLEDDEYLRGLTSGSGGQVLIHRRQTCPFPQNDGIAVASGSESNIGLRLVNVNRLGLPHGTCEDGDVFKEKYGYLYTRQACRVFCLQNIISSKCSCYDEDEEELNIIAKIQEKYPPCRNMTAIRCMMEVQKDYTQGKEQCVCDNPCRETRYEYSLSSRQWPSDEYAKVLIAALCEKKNATDCQKLKEMDIRKLSQKFIKLNIYYEDLNYENITEEEDYEASQFISDVGGTIGLWVGLSVLSMFEVVELFLRLFKHITISIWCRSKTEKSTANLPKHSKSIG